MAGVIDLGQGRKAARFFASELVGFRGCGLRRTENHQAVTRFRFRVSSPTHAYDGRELTVALLWRDDLLWDTVYQDADGDTPAAYETAPLEDIHIARPVLDYLIGSYLDAVTTEKPYWAALIRELRFHKFPACEIDRILRTADPRLPPSNPLGLPC